MLLELHARLRADIKAIRAAHDRTGSFAERPFRWEGCENNPNGWRLLGDLADDIEKILEQEIKSHVP